MNDMILYVDETISDIITDADGNRVAATYGDDPETRRLLAERMMLCWNVFRGMDVGDIVQVRRAISSGTAFGIVVPHNGEAFADFD